MISDPFQHELKLGLNMEGHNYKLHHKRKKGLE